MFDEADAQSTIDIAPVTNVQNGYSVLRVINLVDDTIVAHPNAPTLAPYQFEATRWSGILAERANRIPHTFVSLSRSQFCPVMS